ncbi:MAG: hypothetical protein A3F17_01130 [Gammaproteobacteria bacterium RIFCSPHIGHO2_12_FULL_41_15]|nr:MAG: hypothetical protein A3F17_01130 [Gammaproteobacteria bacterium RIFCSPHIGHO2_12_FULL_41_15]
MTHLWVWICKIESDDIHLNGQGYTYSIPLDIGKQVLEDIQKEWLPILTQNSVEDPDHCYDELLKIIKSKEEPRYYYYFLSALNLACWDLFLKAKHCSLKTFFEITHDTVPLYASGGWLSLSIPELISECASFQAQNINAYKFKVGGDQDEERITALRHDFPKMTLYADSNQFFKTSEAALSFCALLKKHHIEWFEEPLLGDDTDALKTLSSDSPVSIATGENRLTFEEFEELCQTSVEYIQPDVVRCGGITGFLRIALLCQQYNKKLSAHLNPELSAPLIAKMSGHSVEMMSLFSLNFFTHPIYPFEGKMPIPTDIGIGVTLSEKTITQYKVCY